MDNDPLLVSIILLAYKDETEFLDCIKSLFKNTINVTWDLIIVDNNANFKLNHDKIYTEMLQNKFCIKYTILREEKNLGTTKAWNKASKLTKGEYICFLNSDYVFQNNWLEEYIKCFNHQPNIGLVGGMTNITGNDIEKIDDKSKLPNKYIESDIVINSFLMKKELFEKINGWDERYFFGFEDLDLNLKIREAGYKIFICGYVFNKHNHNPSNKMNDEGHTQIQKSREKFKEKWGDEIAGKYVWA